MKTIDTAAFAQCPIQRIVIPGTVSKLGAQVFYYCKSLTDIYCIAEVKPSGWSDDWLDVCTATVHWGYVAESEPEETLSFSSASLTLHADLTINYKVSASLFSEGGYSDPYVVFVLDGVETKVSAYTVSGGLYVFDFCGLLPSRIGDTIQATLHATWGDKAYESDVKEYSIATYCYNILAQYSADEYAELRTLLVDLLNYGAAAQNYTSHNTGNLVNASLTDTQRAWGTQAERAYTSVQDSAYATVENPTATWKSAGLNLTEAIGVRVGFAADSIDGLHARVLCGEYTFDIPASDFLQSGGYYYCFVELSAGYMSEPLYITVYSGETAVSNTLCYSVESYASRNIGNSTLSALLRAMMNYGDAAYHYTH